MKDTLKHRGMRNKLADVLIAKGIVDTRVLDAIRNVPRHLFMDSSFEGHAYQDKAFPIAADQTISQPYTVAFQTELYGGKFTKFIFFALAKIVSKFAFLTKEEFGDRRIKNTVKEKSILTSGYYLVCKKK